MDSVEHCVAYANGHAKGEVPLDDISEVIKTDAFVWIALNEPSQELLKKVQEEFSLHDLAIEDAFRAHQRPKIERYGDGLFIVLRTVQLPEGSNEIALGETHLFVGSKYVVSVRHGAGIPFQEVQKRCEATPGLLQKGPGFVLYALIDFIVDQYFPVVDKLENALEALEEQIFKDSFDRAATEQTRLDAYADALRKQFTALDTLMSQTQQQSSYLSNFFK